MLTKAEMDERLAALKPEHGFSRTTEWSLVDREREALETARQLAEWLESCIAGNGSCVDLNRLCPAYYSDIEHLADACRAHDWLEARGE